MERQVEALAITEESGVGKRDVTGFPIALRAENCGKEVASALQLLFVKVTKSNSSLGPAWWDVGPFRFLSTVRGKGCLGPEFFVERGEEGVSPIRHCCRVMGIDAAGRVVG